MIHTLSRASISAAIAATSLAITAPFAAQAQERDEVEVIVESEMELPTDGVWMHSFDAYEGEGGALNGGEGRI